MTASDYEIRAVESIEDIRKAVEFQQLIWGENATPLTQLVAVMHHGGIVLTAESQGQIIGFSYGFPGYKGRDVYLLSHMLAIHPEYRDRGIGRQLKLEQRNWAMKNGYGKMVWTYDPLETRNAYLNLCKLGGYVKNYVENYYGIMNDKLNFGMPTDRFVLEWDLDSPKAHMAMHGHLDVSGWSGFPTLYGVSYLNGLPAPDEEIREMGSDHCLAPVPSDIQSIKSQNFELAVAWRHRIRSAVSAKFQEGYRIEGIIRSASDAVNAYVLIR
jgi:predicted GNAT superfamily acetyltransferase